MKNALSALRGGQLPLMQRCRTAGCSQRMAPVSRSLHTSCTPLSSLHSSQHSRLNLQRGSGRIAVARRRSETSCSATAADAGSIPLPSDTKGPSTCIPCV